jgi:hypothetical protein
MSATDIQGKIASAIAASEAGDYTTAVQKLRSAKMLMAAIPAVQHAEERIEYNQTALDKMITDFQKLEAAAGGLQRRPMTYVRTTT